MEDIAGQMANAIQALTQQQQALIQQNQQMATALDTLHQQSRVQGEAIRQAIGARSSSHSLVDTRGIAKPESLTSAVANTHSQYVIWRVKLVNWITAAFPESGNLLEELERKSNEEYTEERHASIWETQGWVSRLAT